MTGISSSQTKFYDQLVKKQNKEKERKTTMYLFAIPFDLQPMCFTSILPI